jgi:hypothetical protein
MATPAQRRPRRSVVFLLGCALSGGVAAAAALGADRTEGSRDARDAETLAAAAEAFTALLDEAERERALRPFEHADRFDWAFVPRSRNGLPLADMTPEQRSAAHGLLRATTSSQGYQKAIGIVRLEQILGEIEGRPERRDPEQYFFWIFGEPSVDEPWGWRFEGHHVSLSFTTIDGLTVATPSFMGANPATVPTGPYAGWRVLGNEEDLARELLRSLDDDQRSTAVIATEAPSDIITGNDREVSLTERSGLPVSAMTEGQRHLLMRLVMEYVGNMEASIADAQLAKIRQAGIGELHFAWAGSAEPGEGHYYRIHGPTVLFEYDNTQGGANHVHSTWRDLTDDFGEDLLRRHYEEADHHAPHRH